MMTSVVVLQIDEVVGLLENAGFVWALLLATWGVLSYSFLRRHRNGPKVGPTHQSGSTSFPLKPHMSEEDVFRILTTDETNIQIVRICENPKSAREVANLKESAVVLFSRNQRHWSQSEQSAKGWRLLPCSYPASGSPAPADRNKLGSLESQVGTN